jgi:hypothetical protein
MFGNGIALSFGHDVAIRDCEIARNALDGVRIAESRKLIVEASLAEGNGGKGVAEQTWMEPNQEVELRNNILRNNLDPG